MQDDRHGSHRKSTLMTPRAGLGTVPTLCRAGSVGWVDKVDICLSVRVVDGTISPRVDVLKVVI